MLDQLAAVRRALHAPRDSKADFGRDRAGRAERNGERAVRGLYLMPTWERSAARASRRNTQLSQLALQVGINCRCSSKIGPPFFGLARAHSRQTADVQGDGLCGKQA